MNFEIKPVKIGDKLVGPGQPTYVVAEFGINIGGSVALTKEMAHMAVKAGVDAIKFQTRDVDIVFRPEELERDREVPQELLINAIERGVLPPEAIKRLRESDFGNSTNGDLKRLLELTDGEYREIDRHCQEIGMLWFTACWDTNSFKRMEKLFPHLPAIKIASPCNQDLKLLGLARDSGKPIILSTGMSSLQDVQRIIKFIGTENLIILHCRSIYSTGMDTDAEMLGSINLRAIDTLQEMFRVPVGLSSHTSGIMPPYAAVVRGACMIEKHVTLRRSLWGSDQSWSLNPGDLTRMVQMIREIPLILGDGKITFDPKEKTADTKLRRVRWDAE